jgi:hypothetical protein
MERRRPGSALRSRPRHKSPKDTFVNHQRTKASFALFRWHVAEAPLISEGSGLPACRHGAAPRNARRGNEAVNHFLKWRKVSHPNPSRIFIIAFAHHFSLELLKCAGKFHHLLAFDSLFAVELRY